MNDDDNTQDGNEGTGASATRRARGTAPAVTFEYRVFLDGEGVIRVGDWEAQHGTTTMFCTEEEGSLERHAHCIDGDDLRWIGTADARDQAGAVAAILKGEVDNERAKVVRAAHKAHVDLDFKVLSSSKIGEVPVHWKIVPSFSIGAKG